MQDVSREEGLHAINRGEATIEVQMRDGRVRKARQWTYLYVSEPGDFYYGSGRYMHRGELSIRPFTGRLQPIRVSPDTTEGGTGSSICWTDDTTAVRFRPGASLHVSHEFGPGLYFAGDNRPVAQDELVSIKVEGFDGLATASLVLGLVVTIGALALSQFRLNFRAWPDR